MDDIPEALREKSDSIGSPQLRSRLIMGGILGVGAIALLSGALLLFAYPQSQEQSSPKTSPTKSTVKQETPSETPSKTTPAPTSKQKEVDNVLGHLPYKETPQSELVAVTPDNSIRLRKGAAQKFIEMQTAAKADGIILTPISGFRSVAEQDYLFFGVKEQRVEEATKRAEVSAPPGYSEHHTGYAIDIGDGKTPATNLSVNFEKTAAFSWLQNNAPRYSFELSFPRNNSQGISYEPWHWRYVGDRTSLETFYKARNLPK